MSRRREGEPPKVVMKERKENGEREKEREGQTRNVCMCLLNMCVELCVYCVTLSPVTRVGEGWTGLI